MAFLRLLRPGQWAKNVFVLAGLVFGQKLLDPHAVWAALGALACFCLLSSSVYIMNDIHDAEQDRLHPIKRNRPIAAGQIAPLAAGMFSALLMFVSLGGAFLIAPGVFLVSCGYLILQFLYTFWLKHETLFDVMLIGIGFVLRAAAGAFAVHVEISPWLVICTFTLCLFMGFTKRRCELAAMNVNGETHAGKHRRSLADYTPDLLNHMTTLSAGLAVVCYLLYASDAVTRAKFKTDKLVYTVPFVMYAIFRFTLLVEHGRVDGPTTVVLKDRPFQIALLLWAASVLAIIYGGEHVRDWFNALQNATAR